MRESQSSTGQRVGNHIVLAINVIHGPMNSPIRQRVAKLGAGAEVRPQARGAASGLPTAEDDDLARDQLRIQLEDDPAVRVGLSLLSSEENCRVNLLKMCACSLFLER